LKKGYQIRPFREGDEESLNRSFNEAFQLQRPLDEWRWKFPERPYGRWILVVESEGEVVAQYAAIPVLKTIAGKVVLVGQVSDIFCLRREKLIMGRVFVKLVREFYERFGGPEKLNLLYGFPGDRSRRIGQLMLDYGAHRPVRVLGKRTHCRRTWFNSHRVTISDEWEPAALWEGCKARYPTATQRDSTWYERRFGAPHESYLFLTVRKTGTVVAQAVVKTGVNKLELVDLLWDGVDVKAITKLDESVNLLASERNLEKCEMWLGGDAIAEEALANCGWEVGHHEQATLVAMSFHSEVDSSAVVDDFYYTLADSDLI
jgi:Acetyltransferase (GNAT) domain